MGCAGKGHQIGVAMSCAIGAGLATVVGAFLVTIAKINDLRYIAAAISFATGVMLYISFVDIYVGKAVGHFLDGGYETSFAFLYATLCFFGGIPLTIGLDYIANMVLDRSYRKGQHVPIKHDLEGTVSSVVASQVACEELQLVNGDHKTIIASNSLGDINSGTRTKEMASDVESSCNDSIPVINAASHGIKMSEADLKLFMGDEDSHNFAHAGLLAGLAIAVHNLPEGLVTFISYMSSPYLGITTALAIAIHNIPEGMVVALPVYYATGSKLKAFFWSTVAGMTEPLGAILGLIIACTGELSNTVFGVLFGLISGIMVYVSLVELYPKAKKYDPNDKVTTKMIIVGMVVMALSLVIIEFSEPKGSDNQPTP